MTIKTTLLLFSFFFSSFCLAQKTDDMELVKQTLQGYYDAFYEGKMSSFTNSISKDTKKYGYWKGKDGKYYGEPMSYEEMQKYVERIASEGNDQDTSIKEIKVLDILNTTASARLKFWWGFDFILLAKEDEKWKIKMVLWEGPLEDR